MRILAGVIYSGEPQYIDCIKSIEAQQNCHFEYFCVEHLPKNKAHDLVYETFMSRSTQFDLFVKIDADMVIQEVDFFEYIIHICTQDKYLSWLNIDVFDVFVDQFISGINIYRSNVKWITNNDNYFTDRSHILNKTSVSKVIKNPPKKWVLHCPNPTLEQAFNFGLHRSIKAYQFERTNRKRNSAHGLIVNTLRNNYEKEPRLEFLYAMYGYYLALKHRLTDQQINKSDSKRHQLLNECLKKTPTQLEHEIRSDYMMRLIFGGGKPSYLLLFYVFGWIWRRFETYDVKLHD